MADDDVKISVGVVLDNLQSGLASATSSLKTLEEGLNVIKSALAIGAITEFVERMTELGEAAERSAAILGVSTVAAQELGIVSQTSGGSLEEITSQLSRLQAQMERGVKSTTVQAAALKALGISAQDFLRTPVNQQLNLFADAVKRLGDQGVNAAPALALISRGLVQMMPTLSEGSARIEELKQKSIEYGAVVSQDVTRSMAELGTQLTLAWDAFKGFGETLLSVFSPGMRQFADEVGRALGNLSALIATGSLGQYLWEYSKIALQKYLAVMGGGEGVIAEFDAKLAALNKTAQDTITNYQNMIAAAATAAAKLPVKVQLPGVDRDQMKLAEEAFKQSEQLYKFQAATYQITQQEMTNDLIAALAKRRDAEIKAGEDAEVAREKFKAEYEKTIDAMNLKTFDAFKSMADSLASSFSSALDQVLSKQVSFGEAMRQMFAKMVEALIADLIKLIAEYAILKAVAGTALAPDVAPPTLSGVAGAVFPALGGLLGGATQTTALAANTAAVTANTAAMTGHAAVTATGTAATTAHTAATGVQTAATGVQTGATATQTGVTAAQTVATADQTVATGLLESAQIANAGEWIANTAATIANTAATLISAPFALMGLAGGAWEVGKTYGFPSYAVGTNAVPTTQLALLHAGEMVVPAGPAGQIRDGGSLGGGGDQNISLNISAMDGRSVANMLFSNRQFMQQLINLLARNNPSNASRLAGVV